MDEPPDEPRSTLDESWMNSGWKPWMETLDDAWMKPGTLWMEKKDFWDETRSKPVPLGW